MHPDLFYTLIAFFVCMLLAWLFTHIARHKERVMLIKQGINPDENLKNEASVGTKVGIVIIGLSIGFIIIAILANLRLLGNSNAIYLAILGMSVGGSLIFADYINKKKRN